jgi:hypothetical protein
MTFAQIAALSGYNNPASGKHKADCSGSVIGGGGFRLAANGGLQTFNVNDGWQGAWFGRTNCSFTSAGLGSCETGDCAASDNWGHLACSGIGSKPPATKGEMNIDLKTGIDYYDISLVDGYNLPMQISVTDYNTSYYNPGDPTSKFTCKAAGCLNTSTLSSCPKNLTFTPNGNQVGCQDDCNRATILHNTNPIMYPNATVTAYCCPDTEYCSPINPCGVAGSTCKAWITNAANCKNCSAYNGVYPNGYPITTDLPNSAIFFHESCPNAYSFTYDDASATYTCNSTPTTGLRTKYNITFCAKAPLPTLTGNPASTVTTPASTGNGGSESQAAASGSSSGSSVATSPGANPGQATTLSFNQVPGTSAPFGVSQVQLVPSGQLGSFSMLAQPVTLGEALQVQGQPVAGYLEIDPIGVNPTAVGQGTISFSVSGAWLEANHVTPAQIVLERYHGGVWTALPTTFTSQAGNVYSFSAVTPGFSYFAIVAHTGPVTNTTAAQPVAAAGTLIIPGTTAGTALGTIQAVPSVPVSAVTTRDTVPATPEQSGGLPVITIVGAVVAIMILTGAGVLLRRWWIRRQNPALFEKD